MCLNLNKEATEQAKKGKRQTFKVYKWYEVGNNGVIASPYQGTRFKLQWIKDKLSIRSNRQMTKLSEFEEKFEEVNKGIHCFFDKNDAKHFAQSRCIIAEFQGNKEDLVAIGKYCDFKSAVFMKLKFVRWVN